MSQQSEERMELSIKGRVQGVGFRHFTVTTAGKLRNVTGWVKNEADGSVSLVAEGSSSELDRLKSAVHEGPRRARVESIEEERTGATGEFSSFDVRY